MKTVFNQLRSYTFFYESIKVILINVQMLQKFNLIFLAV